MNNVWGIIVFFTYFPKFLFMHENDKKFMRTYTQMCRNPIANFICFCYDALVVQFERSVFKKGCQLMWILLYLMVSSNTEDGIKC